MKPMMHKAIDIISSPVLGGPTNHFVNLVKPFSKAYLVGPDQMVATCHHSSGASSLWVGPKSLFLLGTLVDIWSQTLRFIFYMLIKLTQSIHKASRLRMSI